jgi:putative hydrolase of the HAD superfamily
MKPQAVVFDLGKVLLDFDYSKVAAKMLRHCELSREKIIKVVNQSPLLHRFETGLMSSSEFFQEVKGACKFRGEFEHFEPIFADIFSPILEMIDLHTRLRKREVPTYIFSNTNEIAIRHIRATYPFFENFTGYIFSYQHRSMKPEAAIYEIVERVTKRRGAELLYIDDRLENIEQGRERRWNSIHHQTPKETIRQVQGLGLV